MVSDPTDDILRAAATLFGEFGVSGTPMSRVAAAAGLGQSSLYYYFASRDELVAALMARANVVPLLLAEAVAALEVSATEKVRRFVSGDVEALCALPFDINEVHRIAARDRTAFAAYWRERRRLEKYLVAIVKDGVAHGEFRAIDPQLAALTLMANDEGVQNWFRLGSRRAPRRIGAEMAEMAVRALRV